MKTPEYNFARSRYEATSNALTSHVMRCPDCGVAFDRENGRREYCVVGQACYDEALAAHEDLDKAARAAIAKAAGGK